MEKRLSKTLAAAGIASRRASEKLIFDGRVKVNGQVIRIPQTLVDLKKDNITVNNKPIKSEEDKVYYVLNKPKGVLCTNRYAPKEGVRAKIVLDLFPDREHRLFSVGRLDKDTEGLLIVTNDGHFSNRVIHPSSGVQKEYLIKVQQEITSQHLCRINEGIEIDGTFVKPLRVKKVRKGTLRITVKEGKKHEIRLLVAQADLSIKELTRIRIGGLMLGTLPSGKYRPLTSEEQEAIFN